MAGVASGPRTELVGRRGESASLQLWLTAPEPSTPVLVIAGEPGLGKTTLWASALEYAAECDYAIGVSRPSVPESRLAYLVLSDLLDGLTTARPSALDRLQSPQRDLLARVLNASDQAGERTWRGVAAAFLAALREWAASGPVLLAIDDLQWTDPASLRVLDFAVSRCTGLPVRLLATERVEFLGSAARADQRFARVHPISMDLEPLSAPDLSLVLQRLGPLPADVVSVATSASGSNPFFALELARSLVRSGESTRRASLPDSLRQLAAARLQGLTPDGTLVCQLSSMLGRPTTAILGALLSDERADAALDEARAAGVIELRGIQWAFTHPLLAAAVDEGIGPSERRELHSRAASVVDDPEERAWHRVEAATGRDDTLAADVTDVARTVAERGAPDNALALVRAAMDLEEAGDRDVRAERRLDAARYLLALDRLTEAWDLAQSGRELARDPTVLARCLKACATAALELAGPAAAAEYLSEAVTLPADPTVLIGVVDDFAVILPELGRAAEASELFIANASRALSIGDPALIAETRARRLWDAFQNVRVTPSEALDVATSLDPRGFRVSVLTATVASYHDRPELAFAAWDDILHEAATRGDGLLAAEFITYRTDLDLRVGNLDRASQVLGQRRSREDDDETRSAYQHAQAAHLLALRGDASEARAEGQRAVSLSDSYPWLRARGLAALGFVAITGGDAAAASEALLEAAATDDDLMASRHGACWIGIDLVQALAESGQVADARCALDRLQDQAERWSDGWAVAGALRCRSYVALAEGSTLDALAHAQAASAAYAGLPYPVDLGRALLLEGSLLRRLGRRREARQILTEARSTFERIGSPPWADRARHELDRIGGRAPSEGGLSPSEALVAQRVVDGQSNAEIAAGMHLSVRTVESHLTSVYRKLSVGSRTQLVAVWGGWGSNPRPDGL